MSGDMRLTKWTRLYENPNFKFPTAKKLKRQQERESKALEEFIKLGETNLDWVIEMGNLPIEYTQLDLFEDKTNV
jgi:hypothetical protein